MSGDTKIQAAARGICEHEWDARHAMIPYAGLSPEAKEVLEACALKGVCVGMVMGGVPARYAEAVRNLMAVFGERKALVDDDELWGAYSGVIAAVSQPA